MRVRLILGWLVLASLVAAIGYAQQPPAAPSRTLSLAEALDIARRNNPDYLSVLNDRGPAAWQLRNANLNLLTPGIGMSADYSYTGSGTRTDYFGVPQTTFAITSQSYSIGMSYNLSGQTLAARGQARANVNATDAEISRARTTMETNVRTFYLNALQAQAQLELATRTLERTRQNLELAQARQSVGQGTLIDVRRSEVDEGQAEVALLRAGQTVQNEQLRLFALIGTPKPEGTVVLSDSFPVVAHEWNRNDLITMALESNPALQSLRARQNSARWGVRSAVSEFLPSLSFSAGLLTGSRTSTQVPIDTLGNTQSVSINNRSPFGFRVSASLPLYDRFSRNSQVAQAKAQEQDAALQVRARELGVRTEVTTALNAVEAAWQTIDIQRRNQVAANEALELATQRYRVGSGTIIELLDARVAAERAATDYITAIYDYHRAIAALENAVGRPLR